MSDYLINGVAKANGSIVVETFWALALGNKAYKSFIEILRNCPSLKDINISLHTEFLTSA